MVGTLILIYFGIPPLGHTVKTNFITSQIVNLQIRSILIFYKKNVFLQSPPYIIDYCKTLHLR